MEANIKKPRTTCFVELYNSAATYVNYYAVQQKNPFKRIGSLFNEINQNSSKNYQGYLDLADPEVEEELRYAIPPCILLCVNIVFRNSNNFNFL